MRTLRYAWQEAVVSLGRARWTLLLSLATIAVAFAMLGAFRVVSSTVTRVAETWTQSAEMSVYLDDLASDAERSAVRQKLEADPSVVSVAFVTKEQALARFGAEFPELGDVTASLDANPFPAAFEVRLSEAGMTAGAQDLASGVLTMPGVADVRYDQRWLARLVAVITALRAAGWIAALALVLGAATTVVAVVRLSFEARREEIGIMALVGAPVAYIRGPFVMEGAAQGALGALVALGALSALGRVLSRALGASVTALGPNVVHTLAWYEAVGLVAAGALVGAAAGLLATWRWNVQGPVAR